MWQHSLATSSIYRYRVQYGIPRRMYTYTRSYCTVYYTVYTYSHTPPDCDDEASAVSVIRPTATPRQSAYSTRRRMHLHILVTRY